MSIEKYGELYFAAKNFFEHGFAFATLASIVGDSREGGVSISESTLIRRYRHKHGIFNAVMELGAQRITEKFSEAASERRITIKDSDPKQLVVLYASTVMSMWQDGGFDRWLVGLAFGYDGMPAGEIEREGKVIFSDAAMGDVNVLDELLVKVCHGNTRLAMNLSCVVLGTIEEFIYAGMIKCAAYDRKYESEEVLSFLEVLMNGASGAPSTKPQLPSDKIEEISLTLRDCADTLAGVVHSLGGHKSR